MLSAASRVVFTTALYRFSISSPVWICNAWICFTASVRPSSVSREYWSVVRAMELIGRITLYSAIQMATVRIMTKKPKNRDTTRARNW